VTLNPDAGGSIDGKINWPLRRSPRSSDQPKIGLSATEFVRGSYDPGARILRLSGYRKDDPNEVIGLDKDKLFLADNGNALGGITESGGTWQGVFSSVRRP
jgi:hypothetical protein